MDLGKHKIVGLAGTFASGKDTLAEHLASNYKFMHVSTGNLIREETMEKYGNTDRPTLVKHANDMRKERGPGVLVEIAIERYKKRQAEFKGGIVISGIRSIGEAELLKESGGVLVFVDADIRIRYERAYLRERDVEASMNFEDFKASEELEMNKPEGNKVEQNIAGVRRLADFELTNDESTELFLETAIKKLEL